MASAPSGQAPVTGRLDRQGRLLSADPELAALQVEAGSRLGAELALPQIAAIARLALKLGVPVSRPAVVAGVDKDIDLWVQATPRGDEVEIALGRWAVRPPSPARLNALVLHEHAVDIGSAPDEWATDEELRLIAVSPGLAERIGIAPTDAVGQPLTRLFRLEEDEEGSLPLVEGVAARSDFAGQRARLRKGDESLLVLNGSVVHRPDGSFAGFRGEASPEGRGVSATVAAGIADIDAALDEALRSPLDRIIDSADRIVQQSDGPLRGDYADYASDIAAAARHLLSVVRSMTGGDDRKDRIDLAALAADAAAMLESAADSKGVAIALSSSDPLMAQGDARGVIQILVNLIGNAVRHSPPGGAVTVSLETAADSARVHVADQGPGVDSADRERIFERFEQGKAGEGGTGLGLAIARRLARAMGGDITLESAPGEGATFTLLLPKA